MCVLINSMVLHTFVLLYTSPSAGRNLCKSILWYTQIYSWVERVPRAHCARVGSEQNQNRPRRGAVTLYRMASPKKVG
jgi:hypothetical protein